MKKHFENNPLNVSVDGLSMLFSKAKSVGIFFLVLLAIGFVLNFPSATFSPGSDHEATTDGQFMQEIQSVPVEIWIIIAVFIFGAITIGVLIQIIISGISDYTSARLSNGKSTTLGEALSGLFENFWGYSWVFIIVAVKTFLWTLLFIIPGIYFSYRYSLAGVSFFDKKLSGDSAVKNSLSLTRGAWLTTFASHVILSLLTFGIAQQIVIPGSRAVLYRQFSALGDKPKPAAHIVSWLTLIVPIVLMLLIALMVGAIVLLVAASA